MQLPLASVHRLIEQHAQLHEKGTDDDATRKSSAVAKALALGSILWSVKPRDEDDMDLVDKSGCMHVPVASNKASAKSTRSIPRQTQPVSASLYNAYKKPLAQRWLRELTDVGRQ